MAIIQAKYFIKRMYSSTISKNALQHLKTRSIIQVKGPDASDFLQGLITNDIHHLSDKVGSMFTMFLNTKGRILYDAIIYKTEEKHMYFIECDLKATSSLQKHLNLYKVKRKVDIFNLNEYKIHVLYNTDCIASKKLEDTRVLTGDYDRSIFPENSSDFKILNDLLIFKDPRVLQLGFRIISRNEENIQSYLTKLVECDIASSYKKLRYSLGIGEGTEELLVGLSFPLECNCDYLHGVSFHKGCYIGQELTARTYHTGVIRKRLMPLFFSKIPTAPPENNIIVHDKANLGKLRGTEESFGLALLRIRQALKFETITVGDGEAKVIKPEWWPIELPKEKLNIHTTT